jgi:polynucleotide 5'-kinase involved in rRNA processing
MNINEIKSEVRWKMNFSEVFNTNMATNYKFRRDIEIGSLSAEDDKYLLEAFVTKNEYTSINDVENNKSLIVGRTGSGKSALSTIWFGKLFQ